MIEDISTEEIIESCLSTDRVSKKIRETYPKRWKGIFKKPFLPGTRIVFRCGEGKTPGIIVDHTDPEIEPPPEVEFSRSTLFEPEKDVFILFDGNQFKNGDYNPYWVCSIKDLELEKRKR